MKQKNLAIGLDVLRTLSDNLPDLLWIKDVDGLYLFANKAICDELLMATNTEEPIGKSDVFFALREREKHLDSPQWHTFGELCFDSDKEVLACEKPMRFEEYGNIKGKMRYFEVNKAPFYDKNGKLLGTVGCGRDTTEMVLIKKELEDQKHYLDYQAHHDTLTGLPNRLLLHSRLKQALIRSKNTGQKVALIFIDLDHFKHINDSYGHERGDLVLQSVAERIKKLLRQTDTLCRVGGDEFAIIIDDLWQLNDLSYLSNNILNALTKPIVIDKTQHYITVSIGISINSDHHYTPENMLKYADSAMYRAKDAGRNNFKFYTYELTEKAYKRVNLEAELRIAVNENQLITYYQPKVDLNTQMITGMECLVRWQHPKLGLLSPGFFVPLAEETNLIVEIDRWVFKDGIKQYKKWQELGIVDNISIALNMSCRQLDQEDLLDFLTKKVEYFNVNPNCIDLEITETLMMENVQNALIILKKIKSLGFNLAIDDFGTGYSSLAYLKKFSASTLKIDLSFVKNLPHDTENCAIVNAILAMSHSLGLDVVAEGIETEQQLEFLQKAGCNKGQGYLFAKPMPADKMTTLLMTKSKLPN